MSNIVTFNNANLPAVASLSTALRSLERDVGNAGVVLLKMDKTGHWVFGADQTEVEDDSTWAVNPFSFVHGFIAWGDGEVLGEKMVSVSQPLPELDAAPPNAKRGWETQIGMSLKCLSGEDKDMEARYTTTSVGGTRCWGTRRHTATDGSTTGQQSTSQACDGSSRSSRHRLHSGSRSERCSATSL